jgi:DNA-binding transcriptional regulator LsrR (DeoR family)
LDKTEIQRIEAYLRQKFQLPSIIVRQRPQKDDSAEVNIGDEFIGVIFKDEEEGEVSYAFNMAILDIDLP